ncbi:NEL-type E3 ubiquitin ligase domain-containing protein [uncultured Pseudomonas sp.]|uniref:NEL-type E3 ubiquitin ligase domain-containing protein n=1 Tax=uncultured Pseudomonas sp. TaxID=114707 RepID=UPI00258AA8A8|nr:NEL-type E3 ubiquitin ligase domain-containing protein [uncultured Pseudomonas sp.]
MKRWRHQAIDGKLFAYLRELHIAKLFDDARVLAVPTGDEDEEDRRERLDAYLGLGLDVLNLAGLFVPLLGQAMLVVGALQIADEVYEGYLDWSVGDRQGALDHLFGVAENIAVGVAVGIGASAAREALQRVAFVDALVPLRNEAGALRLHAWALVDEVEIRLFYRLKLAYALDLPIEPETMHYQSFANVNTSDLLRARREVLAAENTQSLADSLSQRPFWEAYARHHYNDRFSEVIERFHTRLADLEALGKGAIDEWTFDLRSRAKLLRELAEEAFARV